MEWQQHLVLQQRRKKKVKPPEERAPFVVRHKCEGPCNHCSTGDHPFGGGKHGAKNGLSARDYEMIRAFSAGVVSARRNYYR